MLVLDANSKLGPKLFRSVTTHLTTVFDRQPVPGYWYEYEYLQLVRMQ
jgi:hypothetical protein